MIDAVDNPKATILVTRGTIDVDAVLTVWVTTVMTPSFRDGSRLAATSPDLPCPRMDES